MQKKITKPCFIHSACVNCVCFVEHTVRLWPEFCRCTENRGACNRQAAGQHTLAPFCSAYGWQVTQTEAIRFNRSVTKTADDINITHSSNKHPKLTQSLNRSNLLSVLMENDANSATSLQQCNNMNYHPPHGSRHFVIRKPKSTSKIR